jgi:hypothetical protein
MYLAVLVRVRLGSKYALVTLLIILLFISAAAGTELTIAWNVFWTCSTVNNLLVQEVCFSMKQLFFNLTHWILACHYNQVADDVPQALEQQWQSERSASENMDISMRNIGGRKVEQSSPACLCCRKISYWLFLSLNIVIPLILVPVDFRFYRAVTSADKDFPPYTRKLYVLTNGATNFLQVWSGIYLITGILKIRRYFGKMQAKEHVNSKVMLLHAGAFGLYLLSVTVWFVFNTIYAINPTPVNFDNELYALVFNIISDFLS